MTRASPAPKPTVPRGRPGLIVRILAASIGGYGLASALAFALARGLPASRSEAAIAAALAAIPAMPAAAIWAFAARRAWLAAAGIGGSAALLACIGWLLGRPA